jgi:hypothetical protein
MFQESYPTNPRYRTHAPKTKPLPLRLNRILAEGRAQTNTAHIAHSSGTTDSRHTYTNALASVHRRQVRGPAIRNSCNFRHGRLYLGSPRLLERPSNGGLGSRVENGLTPPIVRCSCDSCLIFAEQHFRFAPAADVLAISRHNWRSTPGDPRFEASAIWDSRQTRLKTSDATDQARTVGLRRLRATKKPGHTAGLLLDQFRDRRRNPRQTIDISRGPEPASAVEVLVSYELRLIASRREMPQAPHRTSPRKRGEEAAGDPPVLIYDCYLVNLWRREPR